MQGKQKPPAASTGERAKDTTPECNNITLNTVVTSNAQFLSALFDPDDTCWTTRFRENPSDDLEGCWGGHSCLPANAIDAPDRNAYFSVATFKDRAYANFSSLPVVVLDDAQECQLDPTWLLRTPAGKVQVGYRLSEPVGDLGIAKRLHEQLAKAGHIPLDRNGNNPVRYVRLPIGANTKHDPTFACRLEVFQPNKTYSATELIEGLGLDAAYILYGKGEAPKQSTPADGTFPEGSRNTTLTSFAGSMRRRGMGRESILAALTIENANWWASSTKSRPARFAMTASLCHRPKPTEGYDMATVTFSSTDPVAEALAAKLALSLWLSEQPKPEAAPPARAHCKYDENGDLCTLTVTLGDD